MNICNNSEYFFFLSRKYQFDHCFTVLLVVKLCQKNGVKSTLWFQENLGHCITALLEHPVFSFPLPIGALALVAIFTARYLEPPAAFHVVA
jgi:hypothetical protein